MPVEVSSDSESEESEISDGGEDKRLSEYLVSDKGVGAK